MAQQLEATEIQAFIQDTLELAGATYRWVDGRLLEAFVPVTRPPSFFGAEQPPYDRLLLAFGDDPRGLPPDAELVTTGSYRLGWFIDGVRKRGKMARVRVPYTLGPAEIEQSVQQLWPVRPARFGLERLAVEYETHLVACFRVSIQADQLYQEVDALSINLTSGDVRRGLIERLTDWCVQDLPEMRDTDFSGAATRDAFARLVQEARVAAEKRHPGWLDASQPAFEEDVDRLREYYSDRPVERIDRDDVERIVNELREKYRPRLAISWTGAALAMLPAVRFTYDTRNGSQVQRGEGLYEPVEKCLRFIQTKPGLQADCRP